MSCFFFFSSRRRHTRLQGDWSSDVWSSDLLQAAEAALDSSKATLERNKVDAEGPDVPFLKLNMERAEQMYKDGVMSKSLVEDAEKNYQLGLNKQASAQRTLAVSRAEIAKCEAQVAQAKASLENAQEDLRNSTIVSPIEGLVLSRDVNVGDAVSSILVLGSQADRKSTRLNSSHLVISYAVFCLKKKITASFVILVPLA